MNLTDLQFGSHDVYQLTPKQSIIARKFVVYEEVEEECDETSGISTLTFLNFVLASLSIAASVSSNTNTNANAEPFTTEYLIEICKVLICMLHKNQIKTTMAKPAK